ncbi:hypothetical protein IV38_GL001614 [Lactobacillus selangorensis]|uniref:Uncharacterized protein n=1 Tax=Lactobacillus selangorensis TaxID=81857 RepID=A0A0R2FR39_9LACO|nr:hypothetical protein [Lactobacillus selangorensis]KRN28162.1 hypothetical protein IV38_GL001614 [Lactobacillus selangorensis]KRN30962.1 hypothetical protein IV40_GL001601 [Lactobacillus selangorensis]
MIVLDAPIQQDKIIDLLNGYNKDDVTFKFEKKQGIKLFFSTNQSDLDAAAEIAKKAIKAESWGSVLYFRAQAAK